MPSLILMSLTGTGGMMVVFLAGLQGIPKELYESATMDGAGPFYQALRITVPLVMPVVLFNTVWSLIGAMKIFAQPFVMTQGGPNYSTLTIGLYLYQMAFESYRFGYASGLAWILFAVTLLITLIVMSVAGKRMYYGGEA
jgi:multiple sugar transport system permease protein